MGKNASTKTLKKNGIKKSEVSEEWLMAIAKKQVSSEASKNTSLSKEERIERRKLKKTLREQRRNRFPNQSRASTTISSSPIKLGSLDVNQEILSSRLLLALSQKVQAITSSHSTAQKLNKKNYLPSPIKPNVNKKRQREMEQTIQPRPCDYGGIGLARDSLWIPLDDPSCTPRLEEEFAEHIPGFFGKQRTKAMKKQLDGNMLWRKLRENKNGTSSVLQQKINGKKLSDMNPDERVEAMIKAGLI